MRRAAPAALLGGAAFILASCSPAVIAGHGRVPNYLSADAVAGFIESHFGESLVVCNGNHNIPLLNDGQQFGCYGMDVSQIGQRYVVTIVNWRTGSYRVRPTDAGIIGGHGHH